MTLEAKDRLSHAPNLMPIRSLCWSRSIAVDSALVKCDVWTGPKWSSFLTFTMCTGKAKIQNSTKKSLQNSFQNLSKNSGSFTLAQLIFIFPLFLGIVMYTNELKQRQNKNYLKWKIKCNIYNSIFVLYYVDYTFLACMFCCPISDNVMLPQRAISFKYCSIMHA